MSAWTRSPSCGRRILVEQPSHTRANPTGTFNHKEIEEEQAQGPSLPPPPNPRGLNQIFYLRRSTNPSCFQIPQLSGNVQFSFSPQYPTMLLNLVGMMMLTYS